MHLKTHPRRAETVDEAARLISENEVTSLIISNKKSPITDAGLLKIRNAMSKNTSLEELYLMYHKITDVGVNVLKSIIKEQKAQNLVNLDLSGNSITKEGAEVLAKACSQAKSLVEINLMDNPLGEYGVQTWGELMEKQEMVDIRYDHIVPKADSLKGDVPTTIEIAVAASADGEDASPNSETPPADASPTETAKDATQEELAGDAILTDTANKATEDDAAANDTANNVASTGMANDLRAAFAEFDAVAVIKDLIRSTAPAKRAFAVGMMLFSIILLRWSFARPATAAQEVVPEVVAVPPPLNMLRQDAHEALGIIEKYTQIPFVVDHLDALLHYSNTTGSEAGTRLVQELKRVALEMNLTMPEVIEEDFSGCSVRDEPAAPAAPEEEPTPEEPSGTFWEDQQPQECSCDCPQLETENACTAAKDNTPIIWNGMKLLGRWIRLPVDAAIRPFVYLGSGIWSTVKVPLEFVGNGMSRVLRLFGMVVFAFWNGLRYLGCKIVSGARVATLPLRGLAKVLGLFYCSCAANGNVAA